MKQSEAVTKWCPQSIDEKCLANECMAWRWHSDHWECPTCHAIFISLEQASLCHYDSASKIVRTGYCGLAGIPDSYVD